MVDDRAIGKIELLVAAVEEYPVLQQPGLEYSALDPLVSRSQTGRKVVAGSTRGSL